MDRAQLWLNAKRFAPAFLTFVAGSLLVQYQMKKDLIEKDVFGIDGNGGNMLKILTNLNDYEIAKLKWAKRANWHMKMNLKPGNLDSEITARELSDRGIQWHEKYMEYQKRPPHDKYL